MERILPKYICLTCQTHEVNPAICGTEEPTGKSFCSRICESIWLRSDLQYLSREAIQRIALTHLRHNNVSH